jgi:lycopene cyclase domain-containing protein
MTYFGFLLRFLVIPIIIFFLIYLVDEKNKKYVSGFKNGRSFWVAIGIHILLALIYTTPWDNYLVATGVWYYNPQLVTGTLLGYVPIEEYTFFVLETLFVGLWWCFLVRRLGSRTEKFIPFRRIRFGSFAVLFIVWIISTVLFFAGPSSLTYLSIIFFWALPPIALQLLFGADILWRHHRLVALTLLPMTLYLSVVDSLAITASTWTIALDKSTGILLGGVLPIEEAIFFLVTVALVTFGMTLFLAKETQVRVQEWFQKLKTKSQ